MKCEVCGNKLKTVQEYWVNSSIKDGGSLIFFPVCETCCAIKEEKTKNNTFTSIRDLILEIQK